MAGHEDTGSKAPSQPEAEPVPASHPAPFGTPSPLHREPPTILGEAIHVPDEAAESEPATEAEAAEHAESEQLTEEPAEDAAAAAPPFTPLPPPVTAPPARRGLSLLTLVIAALIGALAGFAGAYGAHVYLGESQKSQTAFDERFAALDSKLSADEKKIDAAGNGNRDALSTLDKRLASAETLARDASAAASAAQTQAQAAQAQAATQGQGGDNQAQKTAGADPSGAASAAEIPDLAPIQGRIDSADQRLDALDQKAGGFDQKLEGLDQRLEGLDPKLEGLDQRLNGLDQRLGKIEAALNAPKTAVRAPQEREVKDPVEANAPAIAIIAETLVQKVASGSPFGSELSALENLGFDKVKLASLKPAAAKGIVTAQALSGQFDALVPSLLEHEKPVEQGGFFDKLKAHAASLIEVRKIGDLAGDDMEARAARVQDALAHDDIGRALKEQAAFPDAAKTATADWAAAAKTRADAIATAKAISAESMANLTKVKS